MHALTTRPGLFQAHVLASPSLWWDEGQPLKRLQAAWPQVLAVPGERLLVLSSGRNERAITTSVDAVADFLQRQPAAALQGRLRWQRVQYAQDDHGTTPQATWADGLRLAFDGWPFDMPERVTPADYTAYLAHRHRRAQRYGADVPPSLFESTHFALAHAEAGLTPQALQLVCELARRHAPTPCVQGALGRIGRAMAHSAQTRHDAQAARDAKVVQLLAAGRASASSAAGQATATDPAAPAGASTESDSFRAALARCPSPARTAPSAH
ncbi:hypothetical protein CCO03_17355 [Comamonas serinivorans]|uniref:Uncharacterized protein n=1 Tax=Comamonas serinivorans TaxID=1082851 RepID=A0A1Y0ERC4_9BURK|nr:hypothetical protein CCO03_17355 [Comamonas serinivorans]